MQGEAAAVERVFRQEYGRLIASLVRRFGDIDIAQDAAGEALVAALEKWPQSGVPPNPGGWLTTTASNRAIDRIRRERQRDAKHQAAFMNRDDTPHEHTGPVEDDRLRLLFTCCHPALAPEARIALTLRLLGGLTVAEIAQAFLVPETTMAQRITRAKNAGSLTERKRSSSWQAYLLYLRCCSPASRRLHCVTKVNSRSASLPPSVSST